MFDTCKIIEVPQVQYLQGLVALFSKNMEYSNILPSFTFFLDFFHFPFGYKLIVGTESACLMEIVRQGCPFVYRHKALFFYIGKVYAFQILK